MWDVGVDPVELYVDLEGYDGPARFVRPFRLRSGWLRVSEARFEMPFTTWRGTLIACVTDDGETLSPRLASRLFELPTSEPRVVCEHPPEELEAATDRLFADFLRRTDADNLLYLEEAVERGAMRLRRFEVRCAVFIAKLAGQIRALRAERRRPESTAEDRERIDARLRRLYEMWDQLEAETARRALAAREETADLEAEVFAALLRGHGEVEDRATIRWRAMPSRLFRPVRLERIKPETEIWRVAQRDPSTWMWEYWR